MTRGHRQTRRSRKRRGLGAAPCFALRHSFAQLLEEAYDRRGARRVYDEARAQKCVWAEKEDRP